MELHEDELETKETPELSDYVRVMVERWWVIVAAVVIVVGAAVLLSVQATPQYRSSARLLYQKNNLDQALFGSQVFGASDQNRAVQTGAVLVELQPVADAVAAQLGGARSAVSLLHMVSTKADPNTNVIEIAAVSAVPKDAADVANAFADQFVLARQAADRASVALAREQVKTELDSLSPEDAVSAYGLKIGRAYV